MTQPPQWGAPPHQPPPGHGHQVPPGYGHQVPPGHGHQPPQQQWPQQGPAPQQHWPQQPPPQQQWNQQQWNQPPGGLPPKPSQLTLLAVLNWILAVAMLAFAAFVIVSFLMSGGTLFVGILLAVIVAGFGLLNALGAMSVNHPHFPNTAASQMAGGFTALVLLVALVRSARRGVAELVPSLGSAALLAVCVLSLVLATRPAVKRWIVAKHQQSLSQGHRPRTRR
ncbi:hypothetical protein PV646_12210 [Streptomyces sp. ID05-26A]|nr:hypothetical protein [Streptomyces sp. ID05-26A]